MKYCAVIATHHKTGTVWMRSVFHAIARQLGVKFTVIKNKGGPPPDRLGVPSILFDQHSEFQDCQWLLQDSRCRIFHLIRDPRDVILSAMHYHGTAREPWLHKPLKQFGGRTYQRVINSLPDDQTRYVFEMQHSSRRNIRRMANWNYNNPNSMECRYEDLINDGDLAVFDRALSHLGFEAGELESCRAIIRANSLFGEVDEKRRGHIRSGEVQQWRSKFNAELAAEFLGAFGDILVRLGYERDDSWANSLPHLVKAPAAFA